MNARVIRGGAYQGLGAYRVENPSDHRFIPGRTVGIAPAHEEAPGWRAILAGYDGEGNSYVVPLTGHFGELRVRKCRTGLHLYLAPDGPRTDSAAWAGADECDWLEAKCLALSVALAFGLGSRA
jgi:hypothetical protein